MIADGIHVFPGAKPGTFISYVNVGRLAPSGFADLLGSMGVEYSVVRKVTHVRYWITATPEQWDRILQAVAILNRGL